MTDFVIKPSEIHGFGCFAAREFDQAELIVAHVLVFPKEDVSTIAAHTFPWGKGESSIVLSELSYCNASDDPRLKIVAIDKDKRTKTFIVLKHTRAGDELTLKYKVTN